MTNFFKQKRFFFCLRNRILILSALFFVIVSILACPSCQKETDYFEYVSELRENIFIAKTEEFSLRVYAVKKEEPYAADGIKQAINPRLEAYLVAPNGTESCYFYFLFNGTEYGGDMSFDNLKTEYFYACTLDVAQAQSLPCRIEYGNKTIELTANSVRTSDTLQARALLQRLQSAEPDLFASMTDSYGFTGEIYLRLIYEDAPYYYVGIVDRNKTVRAFLLNAINGKILARRVS